MLNTVFLVIWNMISQSAVVFFFFSWKFLAGDFLTVYFFLHRNVLEAVPSARLVLAAPRGRCPGAARPGRGPCGAAAAAWSVSGARVAGAGHACARRVPWRGARAGAGAVGVALGHAGLHSGWETGVLVLFIPCTFHRHENWKRWNLWGKSNFPFLLNGFSLILTWFYHVPVEGLRVYTVC